MKICLIGPGIMPIPPSGWGAVEILIWDYNLILTEMGHQVSIINTPNRDEIIHEANNGSFDFVHIHYDCFYDIIPHLICKNIAITSHYPYIDQPNKFAGDGYTPIFHYLINNKTFWLFTLCKKDYDAFASAGARKERMFIVENGVSEDFLFNEKCEYIDKTICLAKIEPRKRQYLTSSIPSVDHYGPGFMHGVPSKGSMTRDIVRKELTKYANMVLLSMGESDPLVVKEGMMAGLGLVLSESIGNSLTEDLKKVDFIDIIPEKFVNDTSYIEKILQENRKKSIQCRSMIREYAMKNYSWRKKVYDYISLLKHILL